MRVRSTLMYSTVSFLAKTVVILYNADGNGIFISHLDSITMTKMIRSDFCHDIWHEYYEIQMDGQNFLAFTALFSNAVRCMIK